MVRRWTPALLVVALAVAAFAPVAAQGTGQGAAASWRQVLHIDSALAGPNKAFEAFDTASLALYDFDGDGDLEIVSHNDNNRAYVIDSRTGKVLTEIETYHYNNPRWPVRELNPIAIGELYGDDRPCMVIPNSASYMSAWCYDASLSTATKFNFTKMWEIKVDAALYEPDFKEEHPWVYHPNGTQKLYPGLDGHAYLADSDGDGKREVFVETDGYPGQFSFDFDGSYRWSRSFADGNAGAKVVDIDDDGRMEAVFVSDGGIVTSYTADTGTIEWVFETRKHGATPGSVPVPALVVDLHGDGKHEIVFGARQAVETEDPNWINMSHARYFALDSKGKLLWNVSYDWMNPLQYNHPAPHDVNGDGTLDVIFLDWNTIGHNPGDWETTNRPANLFALDGRDGSPLWHVGITVYWSNKDFVVADVDGDGDQEIVAPTASGGSDGLGVYDASDGQRVGWFPLDTQMSRGPVAGNLYGDGKLYLVVPVSKRSTEPNYRSLDVGLRIGSLKVIETGAAYDVAFSGNFHLSDDQKEKQVQGTIGTPPTPPPQPTPTVVPPTAAPTVDVEPPAPPTATPTPVGTPPPTASPTATPTPPTTLRPTTNVTTTPPNATSDPAPIPALGALAVLALAAAVAVLVRRR